MLATVVFVSWLVTNDIVSFGGWSVPSDSGFLPVLIVFAPMALVLAVAFAAAFARTRKAAKWPQASGRIVASRLAAMRTPDMEGGARVQNVATVAYEFSVAGRKIRGSRISTGAAPADATPEETLKRYPVGATVMVFYDPADPRNSVLERGLPEGLGRGCAIGLAVLAGVIAVVHFAISRGLPFLAAHGAGDRAPLVLAAGGTGLLLLLFFIAFSARARKAAHWPAASGVITSSEVQIRSVSDDGHRQTRYEPTIEYSYSVAGVSYVSRQIAFGVTQVGPRSQAEAVTRRYPEGRAVEVRYDPEKPSDAMLESTRSMRCVIFGAAIFCFAVAVFASGAFGG